jgi:hypothetical protein
MSQISGCWKVEYKSIKVPKQSNYAHNITDNTPNEIEMASNMQSMKNDQLGAPPTPIETAKTDEIIKNIGAS